MMLCLDVGNSHIYGGVCAENSICLRFRHRSQLSTSDELGIFLRTVLRENACTPTNITKISICSVVPQLDYSLRSACLKYFSIDPFFLHAEIKSGLNIKYHNSADVGADRIANAIAAIARFPSQNLIIIDFGTATTFCVIDAQKNYLGGAIMPGIRLAVDALAQRTAKLPTVEIIKMKHAIGTSTTISIQSGVYYGAIGACRELITRLSTEAFEQQSVKILGTGGFAALFDQCGLYDLYLQDLVLEGLVIAANCAVKLQA